MVAVAAEHQPTGAWARGAPRGLQRKPRGEVVRQARPRPQVQREVVVRGQVTFDDPKAVLTEMAANLGAEEVQLAGSKALLRMSFASDKSALGVLARGGLQMIVQAMRHHIGLEQLQETCCRLIRNAAACGCRGPVALQGVVPAVLEAMRAHASAAGVQDAACQALRDLVTHSPESQEEIFSRGGIQAVLRAMEMHSGLSDIQVSACIVLRKLSKGNPDAQEAVVARGGVQALTLTLITFKEAPEVQRAACWALHALTVENPDTAMDVTVHGAAVATLAAMRLHPEEPNLQEAGCWVLKELAAHLHAGPRPATALMECTQVVLKALERHAGLAPVKAAASSALRSLSAHDTGGLVRGTCLGRCGRLGASSTRHALSTIKE